jgi:hypothetical protein
MGTALAVLSVSACDHGATAPAAPAATASASPRPEQESARREIATAPVLPGAIEVQSSPEPPLNDPPDLDWVVDVNRWWTAPGTVDTALAFLSSHPPQGMGVDGHQESNGPGAYSRGIMFGPRTSPSDIDFELFVDVTPHGDGVAVRANIQDTGRHTGLPYRGTSAG